MSDSTPHYSGLIIGGGIAGLNIAHQLKNIKKDTNFILLQKTTGLDSRIRTVEHEHLGGLMTFELGASIFNESHKVLFELIDYYKLRDKLFDISKSNLNKTFYYLDDRKWTQQQILEKRTAIEQLMKENMSENQTLGMLLKKCCPDPSDRMLYIATTPDYFESIDRVSSTYFKEGEMLDRYATYVMKGGLRQLTDAIYDNVREHVKFGQTVVEIQRNQSNRYVVVVRNEMGLSKYTADRIYLCISKTDFNQIKFSNLDLTPLNQLIKCVSSFREYIVFEQPVDWLKYDYVLSNLHAHWILKMNKYTIMIYSDGQLADYVNSINPDKRIEIYLKDLAEMFGQQFVGKIAHTAGHYWPEGFVVVRAKYYDQYDRIIKDIEQPDHSIVQTIVPKNKGMDEGWMEGHLIRLR
jgi:monoamine oxidase